MPETTVWAIEDSNGTLNYTSRSFIMNVPADLPDAEVVRIVHNSIGVPLKLVPPTQWSKDWHDLWFNYQIKDTLTVGERRRLGIVHFHYDFKTLARLAKGQEVSV